MSCAVLIALAKPSGAETDRHRRGLTLQLSTGLGGHFSFQIDGDNVIEPVVSPITINIGGFLTSRLSLTGRASLQLFNYNPQAMRSADSRLKTKLTRTLFVGAVAQYWITDSLTAEAGVGVSFIGNGPMEAQLNRGLGLPARLGLAIAERRSGIYSAYWEMYPSFFARAETTLSSTIGMQWQWL